MGRMRPERSQSELRKLLLATASPPLRLADRAAVRPKVVGRDVPFGDNSVAPSHRTWRRVREGRATPGTRRLRTRQSLLLKPAVSPNDFPPVSRSAGQCCRPALG